MSFPPTMKLGYQRLVIYSQGKKKKMANPLQPAKLAQHLRNVSVIWRKSLHFLILGSYKKIIIRMHVSLKESESHSVVYSSLQPHGLYSPWNSPDQNTGMDSYSLLQGIFPTQQSNPGLLHCRWILYQLSHQESPRILEQVAYCFSNGSSLPRD